MKITKADIIMYAPLTEKEIQAENEAIAEIRAAAVVTLAKTRKPRKRLYRSSSEEKAAAIAAVEEDNRSLREEIAGFRADVQRVERLCDVLAQELSRMQQKGNS